MEPVYDNLGLRTTAGGVTTVSKRPINPLAEKYSMKDRPLPATPLVYQPMHGSQMPIGDLSTSIHDDTELLFNKTLEPQPTIVSTTNGSTIDKPAAKVPPRPPPKPKKKQNAATITEGNAEDSSSKLFQDECEDGTEV